MADVVRGAATWTEELASLVEDSRLVGGGESSEHKPETMKQQVTGFMQSWGEMVVDLGKGCTEIVKQSLVTEDSFIVQKIVIPMANVVSFLNELLPEDRDPAHVWPVILFVSLLALAALSVNSTHDGSYLPEKRMRMHPPSAIRILLPDGRYLAYQENGVPANKARFSMIAPHSFLSSRLAGIPGVKASLLVEFGIRLITYDLPGFGESDSHPSRNLNSSALDMYRLANEIGVNGKFWVLGYSSGSIHAWAALRYIPDRIAGAVMIAPIINPYDLSMTKNEKRRTWDPWSSKRKLMYFLARKFPKFLYPFYRRSFLSGFHGRIDKWMSQSLGGKDEVLIEDPAFVKFWYRDVEESVRQGNAKPFIEEAVLQVSNWGFSLADLQMQKKCQKKGILHWLRSMYSQAECDFAGFLGPIHIWQGMDDRIAPPSMADYISRVLPGAILHKLPNEGHFSLYYFCDECHRQMFSTVFGDALGPLNMRVEMDEEATAEGESSITELQ